MSWKFEIEDDEVERAKAWLADHDKTCPHADPRKQGAIGGRISYHFTNTSIGQLKSIECACGKSELLNDVWSM